MKNCFKSLETKSGRMDLLYSLLAIVIGIIFLFPLYWLVQISFKTDTETFGKVLTYFPRQITIDPWLVNLKDPVFLLSLRNSFINGFLHFVELLLQLFRQLKDLHLHLNRL